MTIHHEFTVGHLFCGMGGGALGAAAARVDLAGHRARFRCLGGVDINADACADFRALVGAEAMQADITALQPADLRRAWGDRAPDLVLTSPPCKGFSGLLSAERAREDKYQQLNLLVLQGLHLLCSTWDAPPPLIFLENVPRITSRGRELLAHARSLLIAHGYVVTGDAYHDCGELGGLAQHRRRFFLVARDPRRLPAFLYEPGKQRVRACGEVLGSLPVPGLVDGAGPMHDLPNVSLLNLVRLACIPAGGDWRDLPGVVAKGRKRREVHRRHKVVAWDETAPTIGGSGSNGAAAVADPRGFPGTLGVTSWQEPAGTVTSGAAPSRGSFSVSDPRWRVLALGATADGAHRYAGSPGLFGVLDWEKPTGTITGGATVSSSNTPAAVADPRCGEYVCNYRVLRWDEPAKTVASMSRPGSGAQSVADQRVLAEGRASDLTLRCKPRAGAYGVLRWDEAAALVSGSLGVDNGRAAIADPRVENALRIAPTSPKGKPSGTLVIVAPDGTWHRPLTTLELAALQGFPASRAGEPLVLHGKSHTKWRQRIGDAIPPPAAQAVAEQMLRALLESKLGIWRLANEPIWVRARIEEGARIV